MTGYRKARLFLVSSLALTMAGVGSALRANTASDLQRVFFDPIDKAHSGEMIANVLGLPFLGFAFTIAIGSPLLDYIGMGLLLPLSGVCFTAGALIMMFAGSMASGRRRLHRDLDRRAHHRRRLGPGRDRRQPAHRVALPGGEDGQAEHAARVVARRPGHRRAAGCRDVGGRSRLAGQAVRRHPAGARRRRALASASGFRRPSARRPASRWARCSASCSTRCSSCCSARCS